VGLKPSANQGKARLRGLYRIIYSKTISPHERSHVRRQTVADVFPTAIMLNLHHFSHRTGNAKWEGETPGPAQAQWQHWV